MAEYCFPPASNWFSSGALRGCEAGYVAYASHNQIVILNVPEVQGGGGGESENWRDGGPNTVADKPPKSFIINDAHEDKTKVCSVVWCPDQNLPPTKPNLLSSSDDGNVRLWRWSPDAYSLVGQHNIHSETRSKVFGLDWSGVDSDLVVSADESGSLVSWDLQTNRTKKYFFGKTSIFSLALHPEDRDLAAFGCKLGLVFIVSLAANGRLIHKMRGHDEDCFSVSWCPLQGNDWRLVSSSRDKTLRIWSSREGKSVQKVKLPFAGKGRGNNYGSSFATCVWVEEDKILCSGDNGELLAINIGKNCADNKGNKEGYKVDVLHKEHFKALFSIGISRGIVFTVGQDRIVPAFHLASRRLLFALPALNGFAYCLAGNPIEPSIIALGAGDGLIRIWRTGAKQMFDVRHIRLNQSKVMSLAWHPEREGLLGFGTDEGRVGWFDAFANKSHVSYSNFQHRSGVYSSTWGPPISGDGGSGGLCLYSVGDGKLVQHNPTNAAFVDIFAQPEFKTESKQSISQAVWKEVSDNLFLLLGLDDGTVDIYRIPGLKLIGSLKSHKKLIQSLAFHPDCLSSGEPAAHAGWMAAASNETSIHLWNLATSLSGDEETEPVMLVTPSASLDAHLQRVIELAWNPHKDGILVSISYDSSAQVWDVSTLTPLHNFQGHTKRLMCCMWHPVEQDVVLSGGEDCCLAVWRPLDQPNTRPVQRKPQKKKNKQPDVSQPKMSDAGNELSFEELLERHRQHQQQQQVQKQLNGDREPSREGGQTGGSSRHRSNGDTEQRSALDPRVAEKKRRKVTKKTFFPSSSRSEALSGGRVADDCLDILALSPQAQRPDPAPLPNETDSLCNGVGSLTISEERKNVPGKGDSSYLGFFHGKAGMRNLLETELESVEEFGHSATISLWTGNLAATLETAAAEGHLTDALVAQSAGLSQVVWRKTALAYAKQLAKEANYLRSSEYYLAVHQVYEAIEVLSKNGAYQPALAVAYSRLAEDDPVIGELLTGFARQAEQDGNLVLAAKCKTAVGDRCQAAENLAKIATRDALRAAALLAKEDKRRSEMYAKQCLTDCIASQDSHTLARLVSGLPELGWGLLLLNLVSQVNNILNQPNTDLLKASRNISSQQEHSRNASSQQEASRNTSNQEEASRNTSNQGQASSNSPGQPKAYSETGLMSHVEDICKKLNLTLGPSDASQIQEFVRTTNTGDSVKGRVLAVSGDLAAALALKEDPQLCLAKVCSALSAFHEDPLVLERLVRVLLPHGSQPQQVGDALIGRPLDWQCNWPELRSIQASEALALLHSKNTEWNEDIMVDIADAFMLDDVLFCQKLAAEVEEGEAAIAAFDPEKEANVPRDEVAVAKLDGEEVDLTPSLSGTQTVSLDGDGNWASSGVSSEIPVPPGGLDNLPPPPKQTTSFYIRFLRGKADSVGAVKEIQKLKWILSKQTALMVPYPDLSLCCKLLLTTLLHHNLGLPEQGDSEIEDEKNKKISFSQKLARFGYYRGKRTHQQFFFKHS